MQRKSGIIEDRVLLQLAKNNDLDALEIIHDRYFSMLYKYALYRVNDPLTAEDITSEVFTRLIETLRSSFKKPRDLRRWLYGVAHNIVADYQRRQYRHNVSDLDDEPNVFSDENHNPVSLLEGSLQVEALHSALSKLKQDQREVLALRFGAELSIKETAKTMAKSISAVKVNQFRALAALKELLESWK